MKKVVFTAIFLAAALMLGGCGKKVDVTMEKIVAANDINVLLQNYKDVTVQVTNELSEPEYICYNGGEYNYYSEPGYQFLLQKGTNGGVVADKETGTYNTIEANEGVISPLTINFFDVELTLREKILSAEEKDGKLYVETEVSHEVAAKDSVYYGYEIKDGEYFTYNYILDANTYVVNSVSAYAHHTDGTVTELETYTVSYDMGVPSETLKLSERLASTENARTITLILYPDTEDEKIYTIHSPNGDIVHYSLPEDCQLYLDRECTVQYCEDDNNDPEIINDNYSDLFVYAK